LSAARPDLFGALSEQLVPLIASARAAQRLLSGGSLMHATRIEVDLGIVGHLVESMPDRARSVLKAIADGSSPRDLIVSGSAPARLVEDVLCDAAAHGAISAIVGASGTDLLTPAVQTESDRLRGVRRVPPVVVPPLSEVLPEPVSSTPQPVSAVIDRSMTPAPAVVRDEPSPVAPIVETNATKAVVEDKPRETQRALEKPAVLVAPSDDDDDATTMAMLEKSPVANVAAQKVSADEFTPDVISGVQTYMPPAVAPVAAESTLPKAHEGLPKQTPTKMSEVAFELSKVVQLPKENRAAVVPTPPPPKRAPLEALVPAMKPVVEAKSEASPKPVVAVKEESSKPAVAAQAESSSKPAIVTTTPVSKPMVVAKPASPKPSVVAKPVRKVPPPTSLGSLEPPPVEELPPLRATLPSSHAPRPRAVEVERVSAPVAEPPKRDNSNMRVGAWILFALAGVVFAVGSRVSNQRSQQQAQAEQAQHAAAPVETVAQQPAPEPTPEAPVQTQAPLDRKAGDTADFPILPQDLPLKAEDKVPKGQGLLEVIAGPSDSIFVDGLLIGTGPVVKAPLAPKKDPYEIRLRLRGEERVRFALVKEGRLSRLRIAPPWSR